MTLHRLAVSLLTNFLKQSFSITCPLQRDFVCISTALVIKQKFAGSLVVHGKVIKECNGCVDICFG